jgi:hypothetical protein
MRRLDLSLATACLLVSCLLFWGERATAADPEPAGQVMHVPPEEALAILGASVAGPDGKTIGRLVDVLVNASGVPEAAVIDVGGFMGVGTRKIAVHWSVLHFAPADPKQPVMLDLTLDQIKDAPEYRNPAKPAPVVLPSKAPGETGGEPPGTTAAAGGVVANGAASPAAGGTGNGTSGNLTTGSGLAGNSAAKSSSAGNVETSGGSAGNTTTSDGSAGNATTSNAAPGSNAGGSGATTNSTTGSGTATGSSTGNEPAHQTPSKSP